MTAKHDVAEIYAATDGWRYRIKAGNGEIIANGEAYANHGDVVSVLEPIVELGTEDDGA